MSSSFNKLKKSYNFFFTPVINSYDCDCIVMLDEHLLIQPRKGRAAVEDMIKYSSCFIAINPRDC